MASVATATFADRLADAVERKRSQLVVGVDPRLDLLPVELRGEAVLGRAEAANAYARFCCGSSTRSLPTSSRPSRSSPSSRRSVATGSRPRARLGGVARAAGLLVIADGKRGDIGSTARAYATAYLEPQDEREPLADALTVNTYLGGDSIEPFLQACRLHGAGIFCLVRTSNAGAADVQELALSDGRRVWHQVAELVGEWGGADRRARPLERRRRRRRNRPARGRRGQAAAAAGCAAPKAGRGAQGATAADVARAFTSGPASALVTASRSVIFAYRGGKATGAPRPGPRRRACAQRSGRSRAGEAAQRTACAPRRRPPSSPRPRSRSCSSAPGSRTATRRCRPGRRR